MVLFKNVVRKQYLEIASFNNIPAPLYTEVFEILESPRGEYIHSIVDYNMHVLQI